MKRLLVIALAALVALNVCACGKKDEQDMPSAAKVLLENFEDSWAEVLDGSDRESYGAEKRYVIHISDSESATVAKYESDAAAQKYSKCYSKDGAEFNFEEDGVSYRCSMDGTLVFWLSGDCIVRCGDEMSEKLRGIFGEPFAGGAQDMQEIPDEAEENAEPDEQGLPEEVAKLKNHLDGEGRGPVVEDDELPDSYILYMNDGEKINVRLYESESAASGEAEKYDPDDPSNYDGSIVDYVLPVYLWRSGNAIIEFGTHNAGDIEIVEELYGEPFSYDRQSGIPVETFLADGPVPFAYTDVDVEGVPENFPAEEATAIGTLTDFSNYFAFNGAALGFPSVLGKYDESYFKNNSLILIPLYEPTISNHHLVESVLRSSGKITVSVVNFPTGAEAEDYCIMFVEIYGKITEPVEVVRRDNGDSVPASSDVIPWATFEEAEDFTSVQTMKTGYVVGENYEPQAFCSVSDFQSYLDGVRPFCRLTEDAFAKYDSEWFENNTLVVFTVVEGSSAAVPAVSGVYKDGEDYVICCYDLLPTDSSDGLEGWHIFLEFEGRPSSEAKFLAANIMPGA